jgi:hypothetical protein
LEDYRYRIAAIDEVREGKMEWWQNWLWGVWNGLTAWVVLIAHAFGLWPDFPFYDTACSGNWYGFGFLVSAGSPFFGLFGGCRRRR